MTLDSRPAEPLGAPPVHQQPARRLGAVSYLAVRVTGLLLVVLALGHFAVTHVATDVAATGSGFVARRWSSALWVTWDALLLTCAVTHAGAALVAVVRDYRTRPASRRRWTIALGATAVGVLLVGAAALIVGATRS